MLGTDPFTGHAGKEAADWWSGVVNNVFLNLTEGSQSTLYIGTLGTANTVVGGLADPLVLEAMRAAFREQAGHRAKSRGQPLLKLAGRRLWFRLGLPLEKEREPL